MVVAETGIWRASHSDIQAETGQGQTYGMDRRTRFSCVTASYRSV
jgi:hypothetical protein